MVPQHGATAGGCENDLGEAHVQGEIFLVTRTLAALRTPAPMYAGHGCQLSAHALPSCALRKPAMELPSIDALADVDFAADFEPVGA